MSNDVLNPSERKITELEKLQAELARGDHVLFLVVEAIGAVHGVVKRWRNRRRTRSALADLDDQQLRDIGLERDDIVLSPPVWSARREHSYRALARLDDSHAANLSPLGRSLRKEAQRAYSLG